MCGMATLGKHRMVLSMSARTDKWAFEGPAKHLTKVEKALEFRQKNTPEPSKNPGFKKPGSMNPRKTGYFAGKAR